MNNDYVESIRREDLTLIDDIGIYTSLQLGIITLDQFYECFLNKPC